jgi:hypothetical protein
LNENKDEIIITSPGLYGGDTLDYWLGTPGFPDSVKVVQLQVNWKDKIWFAFFSILGSIFIVFLGWLLRIIHFGPK